MRFDLTQLGSREFEHLTQSIAIAELGAGVGVFGSGADGGREATFDGPVPISTNGHEWNGYGVIQAKHKEFLGKPKDDATWLIGEIDEEMKGWKKRKEANRRIPAYYIISTNVRLSPQDDGGIDRVNECLKDHAKTLNFTGWVVWHSDTISTFLANNRDIRIAYASWVTPGDVLSEVLAASDSTQRDFSQALVSFTAKELLRQRYVNLDQAGSADDRNVALAEIFIDLPYQVWSGAEDASSRSSSLALKHLVEAADRGREESRNEKRSGGDEPDQSKFVLVGGPGQGKTTITQFACQMYRAALVTDTPSGRFGKVKEACEKISGLMEQEGLASPKNRRWPVSVQLTRLADDIAKGETTSLLGYLAKTIASRTDTLVTAHQLRNWLATYPWFVALDGLDEVPAASNRGEVLSIIDDFLIEAASVNADVFIVATTRPQGYTDEFSPAYYRHLQLTPLSREVAMCYGKKLAIARHGTESDRTDRLIERLERATVESATSRLMTTPLQVTILAVLLERVGQAPKDRYNLFADYYQVIYQRELEKDSQASTLLRDRQSDVNAIHARVGLLLQTRSEHSGETHSTLSEGELGQIVRARLESEGHKGESLTILCNQVIKAATERLVFLVSTRSDEIGFEIRSLQEFWAAQGIMQGTESQIAESLRRVSSSAHWRNTLLFAVGHVFSKRETLRDTVMFLVTQLNSHSAEHGEVNKSVLSGSRLAVAILSDGMVRSPSYLESLTDQAIKLFELPPDPDVRMVATCLPEETLEAFFAVAEGHLENRVKVDDLSLMYALSVLIRRSDLSDGSREMAVRLASSLYGGLPDATKWDLLQIAYQPGNTSLRSLTQDCLVAAPLPRVIDAIAGTGQARKGFRSKPLTGHNKVLVPEWVRAFRSAIRQREIVKSIRSREEEFGYEGELRTIKDSQKVWQRLARSRPPKRTLLHDFADFGSDPGAQSLASFFERASENSEDLPAISHLLPWVVTQVLLEEPDPVNAARAVAAGQFGDLNDWEELEGQWEGTFQWQSALRSMRSYFSDGKLFYPLSNARGIYRIPEPDSPTASSVKNLFGDYSRLEFESDGIRHTFASWLVTLLFVVVHENPEVVRNVGPAALRITLEDACKDKYVNVGWLNYVHVDEMTPWMDCVDFIGRQRSMYSPNLSREHIEILLSLWRESPERWGLARMAISSRDEVLASLRGGDWWNMADRVAELESEEASTMAVLVPAILGTPSSKTEAMALSGEVLKRLNSDCGYLIAEGLRKIYPSASRSGRVFYLRCAEGVLDNNDLRVHLYERLVEVLGQDPSGMGEP